MIASSTVVVGVPPRITIAKFTAVLTVANSPAASEAGVSYRAIVAEGLDPAFILALFAHESRYGTDPASIIVKYGTKNPGNCRTSRIGVTNIISTERGSFVKYDTWAAGFRDCARRLVAPDFDYARAGAKTIGTIIPIWAPGSDGNDPAGYVANVVKLMSSWIGNSEVKPVTAKPVITWVGSPNHYNGRDGQAIVAIVNHIMVGTMESTAGWFNNQASQVSSTFGVAKDGRIHQYVALENGAWANGIPESVDPSCDWLVQAVNNKVNPNNLTISIEHEGDSGDVMPEPQYQATLALHRWLISLYPAIKVDRQHIIGHYQVMRYTKANCPGKGFPWGRLMNDLANGGLSHVTTDNQGQQPAAPSMLINGHVLAHGMLEYWNKVAVPGIQHPLGLPVSDEQDWTGPDGKKLVIQVFERGVLGYSADIADPAYRVQGLLIGTSWAKDHGIAV